ncbi:MAG TPA: DUF4239 domain-containing protein [Candidatus Angelobacter sp.]|nr:DUF4239 domain-containing protein [Candidatus Angelobacter sp.]
MEAGRRIGLRQRRLDPEGSKAAFATIEGAVFALLGLLVAFTFSGAAERFEARRQLIVQEANAIGTAYLRIDLLPNEAQRTLRSNFKDYLDARIEMYRHVGSDIEAARNDMRRYADLQDKIWAEAVAACNAGCSPAVESLVISSLNEMIDITTTRYVALETHPPAAIFWSLGILLLAGSLLAGYSMAEAKKPSMLHRLLFPIILTTAVYIIVDLEYPRMGFIRIDKADHVLTDLRKSMR